jgi:AAHS family 4-hydroxybenzoate transporter-like MFS transporter
MRDAQTINVRAFIDEHPVSRYQMLIAGLIFLVVAFDGMDIGIMGYAAPEIIRTWGISKPEMGTVLSAVFFGMAGGAFLAGPVGDWRGRKIVIVSAVLWFGITTLLAAFAIGSFGLLILRVLAGIGLGAAIPTGLAVPAKNYIRQY